MRDHSEELDRIVAWKDSVLRDAARLSLRDRFLKWRDGDDTGLSSITVWNTMTGRHSGADHPLDPADLGRFSS